MHTCDMQDRDDPATLQYRYSAVRPPKPFREMSEAGRRCLAWWLDARAASGRLPGRRHFDPTEFGRLLPYFFLTDVATGPRFTFRLAGGYFTEIWRTAIAGMPVDESTFGVRWPSAFAAYSETAASGEPVLTTERVRIAPWPDFEYRILLLPLAADGRQVDTILGAFDGDARAGAFMENCDMPSRDDWILVASRRLGDSEMAMLLEGPSRGS